MGICGVHAVWRRYAVLPVFMLGGFAAAHVPPAFYSPLLWLRWMAWRHGNVARFERCGAIPQFFLQHGPCLKWNGYLVISDTIPAFTRCVPSQRVPCITGLPCHGQCMTLHAAHSAFAILLYRWFARRRFAWWRYELFPRVAPSSPTRQHCAAPQAVVDVFCVALFAWTWDELL